MLRYAYQLNDFRQWLQGLSKLLKLPLTNGRLTLPPVLGEGYLLASNTNAGFSFVVMDFTLNDDLVLFREGVTPGGLSLFFNQVSVGDFFTVREPQRSIIDKGPHRSNIYFSPTNYDLEVSYSRFSHLKRVGIFFPPPIVQRLLRPDLLQELLQYGSHRLENSHNELITFEYRSSLDDIFQADPSSPFFHLLLRNRIGTLAEQFLHLFFSKTSLTQPTPPLRTRGREKDVEALKGVERILSDNQLNKFPSIDMLSKTAMMSSTKLKTRFKQIYGMKLYEFYNHNRLEHARELLLTGHYSVKQVGINIGFSNLSNFAKAFRKEFGVLPKEILKSK